MDTQEDLAPGKECSWGVSSSRNALSALCGLAIEDIAHRASIPQGTAMRMRDAT
jgi:hypothetical protein